MNKESTGKKYIYFSFFMDMIVVIQLAVFILSNVRSVTLSFKTGFRNLIHAFNSELRDILALFRDF